MREAPGPPVWPAGSRVWPPGCAPSRCPAQVGLLVSPSRCWGSCLSFISFLRENPNLAKLLFKRRPKSYHFGGTH